MEMTAQCSQRESVQGGELPADETLREWSVADWVRWFESDDRKRSPWLSAMSGRRITYEGLRSAAALVKAMGAQGTVERSGLPSPESAGPGLSAAPGGGMGLDPRDDLRELERASPAFRRCLELAWRLDGCCAGPDFTPVVLHYVFVLLSTTLVGVLLGRLWEEMKGLPNARRARLVLAERSLQRVSHCLRRFPTLGFGALGVEAGEIARAWRREARGCKSREERSKGARRGEIPVS